MPDPDVDQDDQQIAELEYSPLEALLKCILDAHNVAQPPSKKMRLAKAMTALTDHQIDRDDLPDSLISKALWEMTLIHQATYGTHFEGSTEEYREWESHRELAKRACEKFGLDFRANEEKLRKRYGATYFKSDSAGREDPVARVIRFQPHLERAMLEDFQTIQRILAKYGIEMRLQEVFWRTVGKN